MYAFRKRAHSQGRHSVPVLIATAVLKLSRSNGSLCSGPPRRDRRENIDEQTVELQQNFEEIVGSSAAMKRVMGQVEVVAPTDATVLILVRPGPARVDRPAIHRMSPRRSLPFISLNCAAIPTGLLESELFGYERGAFTGALGQKIGRFEMAHRGTLFLDEVGDIPLDLQPSVAACASGKIFREIGRHANHPYRRAPGSRNQRNLTQMMGDKLFRSDLYHRLKVFPIYASPARSRRGHPQPGPPLHQSTQPKWTGPLTRFLGNHEGARELVLAWECARIRKFH